MNTSTTTKRPNILDSHGRTQLHRAIYNFDLDLFNKQIGLPETDLNKRNREGQTPLIFAIRYARMCLAHDLINRGADVNATDDIGQTALHHCVRAGHTDTAQILTENGATIDIDDLDGRTALHIAAARNQLPMIRFLLDRGAYINAQDYRDSDTPLHSLLFAHPDASETIRYLIDQGASCALENASGISANDMLDDDYIPEFA